MQDGAFSSDGAAAAKAGDLLGGRWRRQRRWHHRARRAASGPTFSSEGVGPGDASLGRRRSGGVAHGATCKTLVPEANVFGPGQGANGRIGCFGARSTLDRSLPPIRNRSRSGDDDLRDVASGQRRDGDPRERNKERAAAEVPARRSRVVRPKPVRGVAGSSEPRRFWKGLRYAARRRRPEGRASAAKGAAALRSWRPGGGHAQSRVDWVRQPSERRRRSQIPADGSSEPPQPGGAMPPRRPVQDATSRPSAAHG
jgi:hypothetical protein